MTSFSNADHVSSQIPELVSYILVLVCSYVILSHLVAAVLDGSGSVAAAASLSHIVSPSPPTNSK